VLGDQAEEEVERPLEDIEVHLEACGAADLPCGAPRLAVHGCDH
jgi:hypothetical protein